MKRTLFIAVVIFALALTFGGTEAFISYVGAAEGLKSSLITFVLTLGLALLGPALLTAAVFFHRKSDTRAAPKLCARDAETDSAALPSRSLTAISATETGGTARTRSTDQHAETAPYWRHSSASIG